MNATKKTTKHTGARQRRWQLHIYLVFDEIKKTPTKSNEDSEVPEML